VVKPVVLEQYVDKGTVRFVSRHFAFLGPESTRAAEAAECAGAQGEFEEYSDLLLANQQPNRNAGGFSDVRLVAFARFAGMDDSAFESCLLNDTYAAEVERDVADAEALGVRGTPSVFVNGEFISPASTENVRAALDRALLAAGIAN
jgi:protein-disulfide isomerase